jgi:hypothetical protein
MVSLSATADVETVETVCKRQTFSVCKNLSVRLAHFASHPPTPSPGVGCDIYVTDVANISRTKGAHCLNAQ